VIGYICYVITISFRVPICSISSDKPEFCHIIIIIIIYHLWQCVYDCIPETNHISRVHTVVSALYLQFVLYVMLLSMLNVFCTSTLALPAVCVQGPIWLFSVLTTTTTTTTTTVSQLAHLIQTHTKRLSLIVLRLGSLTSPLHI
jgi:hypothetical protein